MVEGEIALAGDRTITLPAFIIVLLIDTLCRSVDLAVGGNHECDPIRHRPHAPAPRP